MNSLTKKHFSILVLSILSISLHAYAEDATDIKNIAVAKNDTTTNKAKKPRLKIAINAVYGDKEFPKYKNNLTFLPSLMYEGDKFYARGNQVGYNLSKNDNEEFSVYTQYAGAAFNPDNADENFSHLDSKESTAIIGLSYLKTSKYGGMQLKVANDVLGKSKGSIASIAYLSKFRNDNFTLYPSFGVKIQDEKYNTHYYGISDSESIKSSLPSYEAKESFNPYIDIIGILEINDSFGIMFNQNSEFYSRPQIDSPKINGNISFAGSVGLTYKF